MTTIAYKDSIIAYDSRLTMGSSLVTDDYDKCIHSKGEIFFMSGSLSDAKSFIKAYQTGKKHSSIMNVTCFVVTKDKEILELSYSEKRKAIISFTLDLSENSAIGSGWELALGAMDAGCTAEESVKIAIGRDSYSGGNIRIFNINNGDVEIK